MLDHHAKLRASTNLIRKLTMGKQEERTNTWKLKHLSFFFAVVEMFHHNRPFQVVRVMRSINGNCRSQARDVQQGGGEEREKWGRDQKGEEPGKTPCHPPKNTTKN